MRGQRSLFSDKFEAAIVKTTKQRPRNFYKPERDEALVHRYFYYIEINRLRYDDSIRQLEREFHITAPRIIAVLSEMQSMIERVITDNPTIKELECKFPWLNWRNQRLV
jgi:hypothetical protein